MSPKAVCRTVSKNFKISSSSIPFAPFVLSVAIEWYLSSYIQSIVHPSSAARMPCCGDSAGIEVKAHEVGEGSANVDTDGKFAGHLYIHFV